MMLRTHVYLSAAQHKGLKRLAGATGRSQSALIREAVDKLIEAQPVEDWKALLLSAAGAWEDNPEAEETIRAGREQVERRIERLWQRS